ncbi:MAG TPA: antitoxin Xre/MbcA/ParS toxin-binding domain-containing protein [Candidatus Binataceae bacterium]|nr:antitoxin Xre/MbcA/ParS toxin-binding domain-containing protein [Candidatus Binataceae bacterium]
MQASHVAKLLGGEQVLGRRIGNDLELENCAREGFPVAVLQALQDAAGLTQDDVYGWIIPRRTLSHRLKKHQRLNLDESNRVSRITRIFALAAETLGGDDRAKDWLRRPLRQFAGRTPMAMLATDLGAHQVEVLLGRIAHGIAA